MKSKTSNAIADVSQRFSQLKKLSIEIPELQSDVNETRKKIHELNSKYYRPVENIDINDLYNEITDFKLELDQKLNDIKDEYGLSKPKGKHFRVVVASKIPLIKVKIRSYL